MGPSFHANRRCVPVPAKNSTKATGVAPLACRITFHPALFSAHQFWAGMLSADHADAHRFDATMFMDKQVNARRNVGLVVSLADPKCGIPTPNGQEWEDWDAEFKAITPTSAEQVAQDFQKIVRAFFANKSNATRMVAVFCEDGANLTGYVVVSYMHQVLQMPLGAALTAFAGARDPGIFHAPYIQDLYQRFGKGESAPSAPASPAWALDVSKLVPVRGDFALPAARAGPLPVLAGQSAAQGVRSSHDDASKAAEKAPTSSGGSERLPPGWTKHWSKTHNRPYYFNKSTGKQTWDLPAGGSSGGGEKPSVQKMGALHILYKHQKSRKPQSWKDSEGKVIKARTVADARAGVQKIRDELHAQARSSGTPLRRLFEERARCSPTFRVLLICLFYHVPRGGIQGGLRARVCMCCVCVHTYTKEHRNLSVARVSVCARGRPAYEACVR